MKRNSSPDKVRRSPGKVKRREFLGQAAAGAAIATGASIFGGRCLAQELATLDLAG